jgi:hypothetical protein
MGLFITIHAFSLLARNLFLLDEAPIICAKSNKFASQERLAIDLDQRLERLAMRLAPMTFTS